MPCTRPSSSPSSQAPPDQPTHPPTPKLTVAHSNHLLLLHHPNYQPTHPPTHLPRSSSPSTPSTRPSSSPLSPALRVCLWMASKPSKACTARRSLISIRCMGRRTVCPSPTPGKSSPTHVTQQLVQTAFSSSTQPTHLIIRLCTQSPPTHPLTHPTASTSWTFLPTPPWRRCGSP